MLQDGLELTPGSLVLNSLLTVYNPASPDPVIADISITLVSNIAG